MNFAFLFYFLIFIKSTNSNNTDEPSPMPTISPTPTGHPPSPAVVWITCFCGVLVIGCTVLFLCIKKQPDDMLFDASKEHLNNIANLNTIQSINDNDSINAPLMFTPEGSLN